MMSFGIIGRYPACGLHSSCWYCWSTAVKVIVKCGDVLKERVDVLICTANPQLNMSGGINGEILRRGGEAVQRELHAFLERTHRRYVAPGTVVTTNPGPLQNIRYIVHAVSITAWYESSTELIRTTVENALTEAARLAAETVALPGLAMGYGRLPAATFAEGVKAALSREYPPITELRIVLHREGDAVIVRTVVGQPR